CGRLIDNNYPIDSW
nr:immunoglobulin heavy chain junction region [Macaca mulatta]MOV49245.1 immunoglobulin heavy chain junction region [Macaca mulatta]MOV49341.1 immunoglobulin heavy chain junction region [Macaca mulatta]MOV49435.1 immunoglobulin heavy chain junction region [Macaca mulatta]MOV49551.1 immunoglobulin heavy chain junction region [Macaca mulatta]